jgi:hypothetical protein
MDIFGKRERDFHRSNRSTVGSCVGLDKTMIETDRKIRSNIGFLEISIE